MKKPDFLHVHTNSSKLKTDINIGVKMIKNRCGRSGHMDL